LDPAHQEKMIAWVEANTRLPEEMKSRILKRLRTGKAPQRMIDRLNQRIGG
jgi:cytochrome c-type biogenesis protein CcmH/NrfF